MKKILLKIKTLFESKAIYLFHLFIFLIILLLGDWFKFSGLDGDGVYGIIIIIIHALSGLINENIQCKKKVKLLEMKNKEYKDNSS